MGDHVPSCECGRKCPEWLHKDQLEEVAPHLYEEFGVKRYRVICSHCHRVYRIAFPNDNNTGCWWLSVEVLL